MELDKFKYLCRLRGNCSTLTNILWLHEAYLHFDGDINRYHLTMKKPKYYLTKSPHAQKVCVWFGFTSKIKLQLCLFDSTNDTNNCLKMLQDHLKPHLGRTRKLLLTCFIQFTVSQLLEIMFT